MSSEVKCADCQTVLVGEEYTAPEGRTPCPKCGSMKRNHSVSVTGTVKIRTDVSAELIPVNNTAAILVQAVVEPIGKVPEGDLIVVLEPAWTAIVAELQKDFTKAFEIPWRKWEEIIAGAYEKAGFDDVILTPRSRDMGRDIIATKKGLWSIRIIDQVKAYAPDHRVSANDVRALYGTLTMDSQTSKGLVTTTSDFAPGCSTEFAHLIPTRLELVNGAELQRRLVEIATGKKA